MGLTVDVDMTDEGKRPVDRSDEYQGRMAFGGNVPYVAG